MQMPQNLLLLMGKLILQIKLKGRIYKALGVKTEPDFAVFQNHGYKGLYDRPID